MIEIKNKLYIQRFYAQSLRLSDMFMAVTYTDYLGDMSSIPFYYKKLYGHTAYIDLNQSMEEIMAGIKTKVRNEIRRGEKEGCVVESNYDYESFIPFYNDFCESKGISDLRISGVHTLTKYNKIIITQVKNNDVILAMHATLIDNNDKSATLMYSCSKRLCENVNRNLIGWANRYLHYKEFEIFKEMGLRKYEWNGVCINPNQPERMLIGQFKLGFGGVERDTIGLRTPLFLLMKQIQLLVNYIMR